MLENFSRTVRNYVPTSIPVPVAAPSPPRVSRPVSIGSFMGPNGNYPRSFEQDPLIGRSSLDRRRASQSQSQAVARTRGSLIDSPETQRTILGSDDGDIVPGNHLLTAYPTVAEGDNVVWSHWDSLPQSHSMPRRVLFLGYPSGFQMWDCTNLTSVSEVLNVSDPLWGHVIFAGVLPSPHVDNGHLTSLRPLIGVISKMRGQSTMLIYSLRSHEVVKRLPFYNVSSFASNHLFTVISTTNPPTLHVLSSASLTILHTIPSSSLFAFSRTSTHKPNTNNIVSVSSIDFHDSDDTSTPDDPIPIYSLSHRLLAFATQPPRSDSPSDPTTLRPRTHVRASSSSFGISQADLGNAAIKVGESVLSGMKSLGGMAYNAAAEYAKSHAGVSTVTPTSLRTHGDPTRRLLTAQRERPPSVMSGVSNLFFSRSAPATSGGNHDHDQGEGYDHAHLRGATTGDATPLSDVEDGRDSWFVRDVSASGSYVKVLDLGPLLNSHASSLPQVITEFLAAKHQPISHLTFTHDGNALLVGPQDGQVVRVFQLRRRSQMSRGVNVGVGGGSNAGSGGSGKDGKNAGSGAGLGSVSVAPSVGPEDAPWHVYNLRRGRTSAVLQSMEASPDGRWVAVGTKKGTVHIFAINPYGGQPDMRSHMDTRVWNVDKPQPLSVELAPIARLRSTRATGADGFRSDLSFTFVWSNEMTMPTSLLPPQMASSPSASSGRSDHPSPLSFQRQHNFKDVLVFDASGGVLSLRRITLEQRPRDSGIPFSSPIASLATSISLPGVGAAGRLSTSPPAHTRTPNRDSARKRSGLTQQMLEAATELVGKESTVATWQLKRRHDWGEVKHVLHEVGDQPNPVSSKFVSFLPLSFFDDVDCMRNGFVARSRMQNYQLVPVHRLLYPVRFISRTSSCSIPWARITTRSSDYIRLAISGAKIDVRREVEASTSTYYVEDMGFPSDQLHARSHSHSHLHMHAHTSSSFDEPLANAMSAEMAYDPSNGGGRVTIPMLPNGAAQQSVRARTGSSWGGSGTRAALSGMSMSGGIPIRMMEGVRGDDSKGDGSAPRDGDREGRVPLEFDEQDEDFGKVSGADPGEGDGEELWRAAWSEEDRLAVDEAERFDDVLGVMDEDQMPASVPAQTGMGSSGNDQW
ncbi:hypothetical protein JVU11DRAFT_10136 [Chiua virens]|nr:hypothetical protein JVU11DRAFT_10136 [Chiua virens]